MGRRKGGVVMLSHAAGNVNPEGLTALGRKYKRISDSSHQTSECRSALLFQFVSGPERLELSFTRIEATRVLPSYVVGIGSPVSHEHPSKQPAGI